MGSDIKKLVTTLCIAVKDGEMLLGFKKRGFGNSKWNGFGGKVQEGESIEVAARREMQEEAGVQVVALKHVGVLEFINEAPYPIEMHVFRVDVFIGEPTETEEMKPQWFDMDDIPYAHMWKDDGYWLPLVLQGKKFKGKFVFNDQGEIISHNLWVVEN